MKTKQCRRHPWKWHDPSRQTRAVAATKAADQQIEDYERDLEDPERPWDYAPFWYDDGLWDPEDDRFAAGLFHQHSLNIAFDTASLIQHS